MTPFDLIAFDADDTLWHNESLYAETQAQFKKLLEPYLGNLDGIDDRLFETEIRNLQHYGYGIKAFILSLIETAIELTHARISALDVDRIMQMGRFMLSAEVRLLDQVAQTIPQLAERYSLMIITKGDLLDQEAKVVRSNLSQYFRDVEIVSHKTPESYAAILKKHKVEPAKFLMIGNSLKSDVLPVVALGANAVHIPYVTTWAHEHADPTDDERAKFHVLEHVGQLPALLERLNGG